MQIPHNTLINNSKQAIEKSTLIASSSKAAAEYVNSLYGKNINKRGEWKRAQANAKKLLQLAAENGLSAEKPVIYKKEDGVIRCYGLIMNTDFLVPLFSN